MHPLFVASIFIVTMASPAIVAVRYSTKPKRELALGSGSVQGRFPRSFPRTVEGSLVGSVSEYLAAIPGPRLLAPTTPINQLPVVTSDHQVQDGSGNSHEHSENAIELLAR